MNLAYRYLEKESFDSYEEFCRGLKIKVPDSFNLAYDIIDEYARLEPERKALVWCNDHGEEKTFTFLDLKKWSSKTANYLKSLGVKKGDRVMLILRRRYEFYFFALALCRIGAAYIPCTNQLKEKDIIYRANAAGAKMIVAYPSDGVTESVELALDKSPTVEKLIMVGGKRSGWLCYDEDIKSFPEEFQRPEGDEAPKNHDLMIIYFTSGTTSMPKMACHDFTYPLGHIVTAKYWQRVVDYGLHLTVSDSGWAKFGWGKIYGQWICGAVQFVYDMDRFVPERLLEVMQEYKLSTFCAPPTVYRFLIHHDLEKYDLSSLVHCSTAGEPLNPQVFHTWERITGLKIYNGFGQTETTVLVANFEWLDISPGSMGMPNPAYNIDIVDEEGNPVPEGVEGELVIKDVDSNKPVGLFSGYYRDQEATGRVWHDNIYHTGDVVYKDEYGLFWFVGRNDDVIKASGYRISPFEVESASLASGGGECAHRRPTPSGTV